jgi:hypothetical protein
MNNLKNYRSPSKSTSKSLMTKHRTWRNLVSWLGMMRYVLIDYYLGFINALLLGTLPCWHHFRQWLAPEHLH